MGTKVGSWESSQLPKLNPLQKRGATVTADTLFLFVKSSGRKSWVQRLSIDGKRRDIGLARGRW